MHAKVILGHGMKCTCLQKRLVTQITVFPELSGYSTIKSLEISFQGAWGFDTGWKSA